MIAVPATSKLEAIPEEFRNYEGMERLPIKIGFDSLRCLSPHTETKEHHCRQITNDDRVIEDVHCFALNWSYG